MADREKILRYFRAGGDEELAAKLLDLAEGAHRSRKFRVSDFLDPHGCNVAEIVAANFENVKLETSGGFKNAERMKVAFVAEDFLVSRILAWSALKSNGTNAIMNSVTAIFWELLWGWAVNARFWAILFLSLKEHSS